MRTFFFTTSVGVYIADAFVLKKKKNAPESNPRIFGVWVGYRTIAYRPSLAETTTYPYKYDS